MNLGIIISTLSFIVTSYALQNCPLLGPDFPPPKNLSSNPIFKNVAANFTNLLQEALRNGNMPAYGPLDNANTSFSVSLFSVHEDEPIFEVHHTSPTTNSSSGVSAVDGDTVYRMGSLSKLLTVYLFLIEDGDVHWNEPVTKFVPELAAAAAQERSNTRQQQSILRVDWNDVTIGALASQLADIGRDYAAGDLAGTSTALVQDGLPPLDPTTFPSCLLNQSTPCSREDFFRGFVQRDAVLAPFTTPIYSNVAFQILGYALENITGDSFQSMLEADLFKPLKLKRSSYSTPSNSSMGIIPIDMTTSYWNANLGDESPTGGMSSSTNDLSAIGRSILNSSFLSDAQTRRWLKPHSHAASIMVSVGAPWEIRRIIQQPTERVTDLYTKSGDIGAYSCILVLAPDYDAGFVIMAASSSGNSNSNVRVLADMIANTFLPSFEDIAKTEADIAFGGTYTSRSPNLNSSIILATDPIKPGLGMVKWISNGTDMFPVATVAFASSSDTISIRMYPTNLRTSNEVAFRAVIDTSATTGDSGPFSHRCITWTTVDSIMYGGASLDEFVFALGMDSKAVSVNPKILRTTLEKVY
ncbi:MAG: hypothetical protein M1834_003885 [Cirrosporium novae-zelandiae]|nr:MAG: hypothetical protein M1834_003885 [Cirrosporium novae-zelandiae]